MRIRPLACCAAHHHCSQRRCARCSSRLDRWLPPSRLPSRGGHCRLHPRRPPDPPTRRRSPPLRLGVVASNCSATRRVAVPAHRGAPDRVASAALDRGLQLDGAMSSPGPAAKLALKRQTGLMGGDMGLAATTAAAQAQRSASAAQPAAAASAAAVATGTYTICRRIRSAVTSGVSAAAQHQRCPAQGRRQSSR